jgi:hypothetical protein
MEPRRIGFNLSTQMDPMVQMAMLQVFIDILKAIAALAHCKNAHYILHNQFTELSSFNRTALRYDSLMAPTFIKSALFER